MRSEVKPRQIRTYTLQQHGYTLWVEYNQNDDDDDDAVGGGG